MISKTVFSNVVVSGVLLIAGCASTIIPTGDREEVRDALLDQQELAVELYLNRLVHVNDLAMPILKANNDICGNVSGRRIGVTILTKRVLPPNLRDVAENVFGIGSRPVIYLIPGTPAARSALNDGDRLYKINGRRIGDNFWSQSTAHNVLKNALDEGGPITLQVMRRGSHTPIVEVLEPEPMCKSFVYLIQDSLPNAFADGADIFVYTGMVKEVESDYEMQVVLAHELAHNAESHIAKSGRVGLAGAVLDAIISDEDDDEGLFSSLAVLALSPSYEREADYVGIYMLARAGLATKGVSTFWKRLAAEYPEENERTLLTTHPIHTERYVNLDKAHQEIVKKLKSGEPLVPERK